MLIGEFLRATAGIAVRRGIEPVTVPERERVGPLLGWLLVMEIRKTKWGW